MNGAIMGAARTAVTATVAGAIGVGIAQGAPMDVVAARLAVCNACPLLSEGRCGTKANGGCGCWVSAKAALLNQTCPQKKW
jgi:hypothetical protein